MDKRLLPEGISGPPEDSGDAESGNIWYEMAHRDKKRKEVRVEIVRVSTLPRKFPKDTELEDSIGASESQEGA